MRTGTPMPSLEGATAWLNGIASREGCRGNPTLVHFWAKSCHVCHDYMPTISLWRDEYGDNGLKVVAIHMPREEADTGIAKVVVTVAEMVMTEPCAIDNQHAIGERFENALWPAYYLFDAEGNLRGRAGGYAGLSMIKGPLGRMLGVEIA